MKMKKIRKNGSYNIIIASLTDANKKARALTMSRRAIVTSIISAVLVVVVSVSAAVYSVSQVYQRQTQAETLTGKLNEQLALLDAYEARIASLQLAKAERDAIEAAQAAGSLTMSENAQGTEAIAQGSVEPIVFVQEAVQQINDEYCGEINAQVEALKQVATADAVDVIYSGDMEGDSDTVNNWADVLAVFVVETGYNLDTLQAITESDCGLLEQIYRDMNQYEITSQTTAESTASEDGESVVYSTRMTISIAVDSWNGEEYADQMDWDRQQTSSLDALMDPDYYMTYAALLGVDLYDGLNSDELAEIIAGLDPDLIGTMIVKAALTRVGDPYSNARRGSGSYVDCSYLTFWAYQQAGVDIPTSSVEQAKYCYNNGYVVDLDALQPGDLLYWQKTSCHCGRWHEIHHAGIYLGNGLVIEASSSQGCVVIRPLWNGGEWRLYMAARPYEETPETAMTPIPVDADAQ